MTQGQTELPVLHMSGADAAALGNALRSLEIDDASLTDPAYQSSILAKARDAAGQVFDDLAERTRDRLQARPWFVVVRGLPAEQATQILVAVSATLGELVEPYRRPWSRVVRHIVPSRDRAVDGHVLNEFLHTDGTDWARPNDYTCLFCVRPDQRGDGESRLLDVNTLIDGMATGSWAKLLDRIADRPLPWRIADELGGGTYWAPAIELAPLRMRWLRYTVTLSCQDGLASLSKDTLDDLQELERFLESCPGVLRTSLESGDLLLIDNTRCLHARTAIGAPSLSTRELRRTKVMRTEV